MGQWIEGANGGANGDPYTGGAYTGLLGEPGIDYNDSGGGGAGTPYRFEVAADVPGPETRNNIGDLNRGLFQVDQTWTVGWNDPGQWLNFTRDFPEEPTTYEVVASIASGGNDPNPLLQRVTSDPTQADQTVETLGEFSGAASGNWDVKVFYKMHEEGNPDVPQRITLIGVQTLRLTMGGNMDPDYLAFVPVGDEPLPGPELSISLSGDNVTLSWEGDAQLQSAPAVTGPWEDTGEASPATIPIGDSRMFFRTRTE